MIRTGAVVYGPIVISDNVTIGPNACVDKDVPPDTICFAPRCILVQKKTKIRSKLLPDMYSYPVFSIVQRLYRLFSDFLKGKG